MAINLFSEKWETGREGGRLIAGAPALLSTTASTTDVAATATTQINTYLIRISPITIVCWGRVLHTRTHEDYDGDSLEGASASLVDCGH